MSRWLQPLWGSCCLDQMHLEMYIPHLEDLRVKATAVQQAPDFCKCWLGFALSEQYLESNECTIHTVWLQVGRDVQKLQCPSHGSKDEVVWGSFPCFTTVFQDSRPFAVSFMHCLHRLCMLLSSISGTCLDRCRSRSRAQADERPLPAVHHHHNIALKQ